MAKIYSQILNNRVDRQVENNKAMVETQMGFRKFRSTQVPTAAICTIIARRKKEGKETHVMFLDLKKAFDSVHRGAIWEAMQNQGVSTDLINAIRKMYENTTSQYLTHYGPTKEIQMERGVRQGCPLSRHSSR